MLISVTDSELIIFKSMHNKTAERKINWLRLGHTNLKAHLTDKTTIDNPMCKCELAHETPLYVLLHCKLNDTHGESLINSIEFMYVQKQIPYYLSTIDFDTLAGFNKQHSLEVRYHLAGAISTFLYSITSSIWPGIHPIHYNVNNTLCYWLIPFIYPLQRTMQGVHTTKQKSHISTTTTTRICMSSQNGIHPLLFDKCYLYVFSWWDILPIFSFVSTDFNLQWMGTYS